MAGAGSVPTGSQSEFHRVRLEGWKAIASCLNKSVPTARSWIAQGLPVHRIEHPGGKTTVFAYGDEIDAWINSKPAVVPLSVDAESGVARPRRRLFLPVAFAVVLIAAVAFPLRSILSRFVLPLFSAPAAASGKPKTMPASLPLFVIVSSPQTRSIAALIRDRVTEVSGTYGNFRTELLSLAESRKSPDQILGVASSHGADFLAWISAGGAGADASVSLHLEPITDYGRFLRYKTRAVQLSPNRGEAFEAGKAIANEAAVAAVIFAGLIHYRVHDNANARVAFTDALERLEQAPSELIDPAVLHYYRGLTLHVEGLASTRNGKQFEAARQLSLAIEDFELVLRKWRRHPSTTWNLALVYSNRAELRRDEGQKSKALADFRRAASLFENILSPVASENDLIRSWPAADNVLWNAALLHQQACDLLHDSETSALQECQTAIEAYTELADGAEYTAFRQSRGAELYLNRGMTYESIATLEQKHRRGARAAQHLNAALHDVQKVLSSGDSSHRAEAQRVFQRLSAAAVNPQQ